MSMTPSRRRLEAVRLKHLAAEGWVLIYRCRACRTVTAFLATDVVEIWGPDMQVYVPPAPCGRCGGPVQVQPYFPTDLDRGKLRLRRPAGMRQLWKWEFY